MNIQEYMISGVERIVKEAIAATLKDPKESAFMARFALSTKKASAKRKKLEEEGLHVPAFLISSITSSCNLHCAGCYSRANTATVDTEPEDQLSGDEWDKIFSDASDLGISFILLAGGEPLMRRDVIEKAKTHKDILFPIFTNGTYLNDSYLEIFDKNRNLIPVISIEGDEVRTDNRRGDGIYRLLMAGIDKLNKRRQLFGTSVTVTTENMDEVFSDDFVDIMSDRGCKVIFYVEYVPMSEDTEFLAPGDEERDIMIERINELRRKYPEMLFVAFPGDEKSSGGCLAAGRGFFHINSHGAAEPCPFSPYSDINVKDSSLREALESKLFLELRDNDVLNAEHIGGCVLYEKRKQVEELAGIV